MTMLTGGLKGITMKSNRDLGLRTDSEEYGQVILG
jgi:hypothetical protein